MANKFSDYLASSVNKNHTILKQLEEIKKYLLENPTINWLQSSETYSSLQENYSIDYLINPGKKSFSVGDLVMFNNSGIATVKFISGNYFQVENFVNFVGEQGPQGPQGIPGQDGQDGQDGTVLYLHSYEIQDINLNEYTLQFVTSTNTELTLELIADYFNGVYDTQIFSMTLTDDLEQVSFKIIGCEYDSVGLEFVLYYLSEGSILSFEDIVQINSRTIIRYE